MQEATIAIGAAALLVTALLVTALGIYFTKRNRPRKLASARQNPEQISPHASRCPAQLDDTFETGFYQTVFTASPLENASANASIVVKAFEDQRAKLMQDPTLLPRQPLILPRLLQAVKHQSGDANELVQIIMQDPGLTADVLKMSNSPLYRNTQESVNDMEYAVVMLGIDGLKSVICASIMRPIFNSNSTNNKNLAPLMWEYGLAAAFIAQRYTARVQPAEAFTSHLLTLLTCIAELMLVQAATRLFKEIDSPVESEVLIQLMETYRYPFTVELMQTWALDESLTRQLANPKHTSRSQLKTAQQLGRIMGRAVVMLEHDKLDSEAVITRMTEMGIDQAMVEFLLSPSDRARTSQREMRAR
jgi:HD-like signal output (HDOD) protein